MKKKGFTLIELLGVIVILAILVLLATPAVTSLITKSQKSTFVTELQSIEKDAEKAYIDASLMSDELDDVILTENGKEVEYKYLCVTLDELVKKQYTKKDLTGYQGYVEMYIPVGGGETKYRAVMSDGKYYTISDLNDVDAEEVKLLKSDTDISFKCNQIARNYLRYLNKLNRDDIIKDDLSDDHNKRFIGAEASNYAVIKDSDGSEYNLRIIGIFDEHTHGKENQKLVKVIATDYKDKVNFDTNHNSSYAASDINKLVNGYKIASSSLFESVTWTFGSYSLSDTYALSKISTYYQAERQNRKPAAANSNYKVEWTGVVGLPYLTDGYLATNGSSSLSREKCIKDIEPFVIAENTNSEYTPNEWTRKYPSEGNYTGECSASSWLHNYVFDNATAAWTLMPIYDNTDTVFAIRRGAIYSKATYSMMNEALAIPTLYLNPDVMCHNCKDTDAGSESNPYILSK